MLASESWPYYLYSGMGYLSSTHKWSIENLHRLERKKQKERKELQIGDEDPWKENFDPWGSFLFECLEDRRPHNYMLLIHDTIL